MASPSKRARTSVCEAKPPRPTIKRSIFLSNRPHPSTTPFSLITSLCRHVDVLLNLVQYLPPKAIVNLYSISAHFHFQFSSHHRQFILAATTVYCPDAPRVFPWKCYSSLCIVDPGLRLVSTHKGPLDPSTPRPVATVPALTWLRMCVYRTLVTSEIVGYLAALGFALPSCTASALRKVWFLLDLPLSAPRIALIRNREFFTDADLVASQMFFLKLDAAFTDPVVVSGTGVTMTRYLLAERSLTQVWDWLRGEQSGSIDVLRLWVRHGYEPLSRDLRSESPAVTAARENQRHPPHIMGISLAQCGRAGYELHGRGRARLIRPDQLVVKESVRRALDLDKLLMKMLRWGTTGPDLLARRIPDVEEAVWSKAYEQRKKRLAEQRHRQDIETLMRDAEVLA